MNDAVATTGLYRIAREAVCNAVKHAAQPDYDPPDGGRRASVSEHHRRPGVGFAAPEGPRRGMGLEIMRFRANSIGGVLDIQPAVPKGTVVSCYISRSRCEGKAA